jgi:RNA recognition motif-containing protein
VKAPSTTANRPNSNPQSGQQQQQRGGGGGNYYQQNNRGNYWNDNSQQDHSPARRSGSNVATAPNEQQVFVGSLPLEFTKEILIDYFSQYGTVLDAKIHTPTHDNKKVCLIPKTEFFIFLSFSRIEFWLCRF